MKVMKSQAQIERPDCMKKRVYPVKQKTGLALALIGLIIGLALPGYCRSYHASNQATIPTAANSVWSNTDNLNTARYSHTATLLANGKVLVAGGLSPDGVNNRAELYDPDTETWNATGDLNSARAGHTATLLANGKVLVAGGSRSYFSISFDSAELYDPETGTWSYTGKVNARRFGHTATLLANGKVLVSGGFSGGPQGSFLDSAELYDPDTGTWSYTGSLKTARDGHTATLLADGKVLVAGGTQDGDLFDTLASSELYDPDIGTWSITGNLGKSRMLHTATLLADGKVLVANGEGGYVDSYSQFSSAELYDPAIGTWSDTSNLYIARAGHTATLLANGKVLIAGGGYTFSGNPLRGSFFNSAELYDSNRGIWYSTDDLNTGRTQHTATLLQSGKVLFTGGRNLTGNTEKILDSAELYDPGSPIAIPKIISATVAGKKLFVFGENFISGAVILLNGQEQVTKGDAANPKFRLIGKNAGKKIKAGDRVQVRNPDGSLSEEFIFTGS